MFKNIRPMILLMLTFALSSTSTLAQTKSGAASSKVRSNLGAASDKQAKTREAEKQASSAKTLTQSQLWALACSAVLTEKNQESHDILWTAAATEENIRHEKRALAEGWDINSRNDLLNRLNSLLLDGHRKSFDEFVKIAQTPGMSPEITQRLAQEYGEDVSEKLKIAKEYGPRLGMRSIIAFDYCRYISLCRWGTLCSYISQDEAWGKIMPIAQSLQNSFPSWKELGENYMIGRKFWQPKSDQEAAINAAYKKLLTDPNSPWLKIPWNTKLTSSAGTQ